MKKIILLSLTVLLVPYFTFSQDISQIIINNEVFTIGKNTFQEDYDLIYKKWYRDYFSIEDIKPGDDISWITDFVKNNKLKEPSICSIKLFDVEFEKYKMLKINDMRLLYDDVTNIFGGYFISSSYSSYVSYNVKDILNTMNFVKIIQPAEIEMKIEYDLSDSTKNIVSEFLIDNGSIYIDDVLLVSGRSIGKYIYSLSVSAENYKKINDLKVWHKNMERKLPREYDFTIKNEITLVEFNKRKEEETAQLEREKAELERERIEQKEYGIERKKYEIREQVEPILDELRWSNFHGKYEYQQFLKLTDIIMNEPEARHFVYTGYHGWRGMTYDQILVDMSERCLSAKQKKEYKKHLDSLRNK